MCEYSRKEFEEGLAALGCDSIDKLKAKLPSLRQELQVGGAKGWGSRGGGDAQAHAPAACSLQ